MKSTEKREKVLPRDVSYHVLSDEPIHIDFMRVISGKKIVIEIPVKFKNQSESPGLKRGGVLNIVRRKVEIKCSAESIPDDIIIDLAGSDIGTSIKISSVKLPENAKPTISDRDFVIATVAAPTIIKEPEKPAEAEATEGTEGEASTEGAEGATATAAKERVKLKKILSLKKIKKQPERKNQPLTKNHQRKNKYYAFISWTR